MRNGTATPNAGRRVKPIDLFRDANYRRLWLTGGFVGIIRWLELLAITIYVYEVTGSAFQTALMTFFRFLPMVLLGAAIGVIAERLNRRRLMLAAIAALCVVTAALGALAMTDHIAVWQIAVGAFLGGAVHTSEFPVRRTMLGEIAGPDRAKPALAMDSVTNNGTRLIGPVAGGVIFDQFGLAGTYFFCTALYAIGLILTLRVHYVADSQTVGKSHYYSNIIDGFRFIRRQRMIVGALCVTILVNMFAVPFTAMIPVIGKEEMSLSASWIGVLASSEGIGALVGAISIVMLQPANFPRTYVIGATIFLACVVGFAASGNFFLALTVLIVCGLGHAGFSTTQSAIMFAAATPEMRSRVLGVLATCIGASPLGVLNLGLLAEWLGAPMAVAVMALEGLILLAIVLVIFPELYRDLARAPLSDTATE